MPGSSCAELVGGEARVRLAALERLVAVVRLEERVDQREERPCALLPRSTGIEERDAKEQVRRDAPGCAPSRGTSSR